MSCQIFNCKALVIGNDNVPGLDSLDGVKDNMNTMKETLEKMNIPVTFLPNKTKDEIKTELKRLEIEANKADKTGEPFQYMIYYAGHGAILANDNIPTV